MTVNADELLSWFQGYQILLSIVNGEWSIENHRVDDELVIDKGSTEKKTGQLFKNLELSGEVEVTGQKSNHFLEDLKSLASITNFKK